MLSQGRYQLANNVTGDGNATGVNTTFEWPGGEGVFTAPSGSATSAKLQYSQDDGVTFQDVDRAGDTYVTFTAFPGGGRFFLPVCLLRVNYVGAANLSAYVAQVPNK